LLVDDYHRPTIGVLFIGVNLRNLWMKFRAGLVHRLHRLGKIHLGVFGTRALVCENL